MSNIYSTFCYPIKAHKTLLVFQVKDISQIEKLFMPFITPLGNYLNSLLYHNLSLKVFSLGVKPWFLINGKQWTIVYIKVIRIRINQFNSLINHSLFDQYKIL